MNIPHKIAIFFIFFFSVSCFVLFSDKQPAVLAQNVPSPACLGACPTPPPDAPTIEPISTAPCDASTNFTDDSRRKKYNGGKKNVDEGLLAIILELLAKLLELLFGGGGNTPLPTPQPLPVSPEPCHPTPIVAAPTDIPAPPDPTDVPLQLPTNPPVQQPTTPAANPTAPLPGTGVANLIYPPSYAASTTRPGYFQLPPTTSPTNGYTSLSCANKLWGAKELVGVLYTVAQNWRQKYPQGYIRVADMNGTGHEPGHTTGESVDLDGTTNGTDCVADFIAAGVGGNCSGTKYNREATIELAKMFIDTGLITRIIYLDQTVNAAMDEYARSKGATRNKSLERPDHDSHFHIDLTIPKLATWAPDC